MLPTFKPGDTLLALRWFTPSPGQIVVANISGTKVIKRIDHIESGDYWLLGDNQNHSTDSRSFGAVKRNALEARILLRL